VAQVSAGGTVTALARGHAAVIASTPWGAADTADVYVQGELLFTSTRGGSVDLWAIDRRTPAQATQVTRDPGAEVSTAFSPDGSRIAFVSTRDGNPELYVANADGSDARRISETPGAEDSPSWSRDGRMIYFAAAAPRERMQIEVVNADGTGRRRLTQDTAATNYQPVVSPDGQTVAFTSTRDGNYEIYLMDPDGSNQRNVTETPGKETLPQWWPDGELGYLVEQRSGNAMQSLVMRRDLTSGQAAAISPSGLMVTDYAIASDGQMLALVVERFADGGGIQRRLFLLPMTGGGPVEVAVAQADEQQSSPGWR
jgi:Tol biopolymer transport system component